MRLPRLRFTVRRMMVAVAAVGVLLGIAKLAWLRQVYQQRAEKHSALIDLFERPAEHEVIPWFLSRQEFRAYARERVNYHVRMVSKYRSAASHPWQTISVDPPLPHLDLQ